jgi:tetratricopeptide (TPR) repeat protein
MEKPALPFLWNRDWVWGLLLLGVMLAAYQPAWNGKPVLDDELYITPPELRSTNGLAQIWTHPRGTVQYYPLVHSVFWVEYRLWGDSTLGYHLLSILLHAFSALLLVRILRKLSLPGEAAWLAGGIFALHPVMVESVAWITELKNTLSGVFFLCAGLAYLKFDHGREKKHYAVALILFLLGLLSKSVIVTLPAALLAVFWWKRGRIGWKRDVAPLVPFFAIGIISGLFTAWVERRYIVAAVSEFNLAFIDRCLIAGRAVWFYLYKLLWPVNLIFIYPRWHIDATAVRQYMFPAAFLLAAVLCWGLRSRSRAPLAVLLYFTITLFPALSFFNVYWFRFSFVADHFQYLAGIGPLSAAAAIIVQGTGLLQEKLRRPLQPLLCGMLLSVLFLLSRQQSRMYSDAETLYRTIVTMNGNSCLAHNNLGVQLANMGRTDEALVHYQKALELDPNYAETHYNLNLLLAKMGRTDEALAHYQKALELNPNQAEAHDNLGLLFADMGQPDKALVHYQRALEINPNYDKAHYNLGILLADMGRTDEALVHFQKALECNPHHAEAHSNLGLLCAKMGRTDEALAHYRKALELDPNRAETHNNLGALLAQFGRTDEALAHYLKALEINPYAITTLQNLAVALSQKGRWTDATLVLKKALALAKSAGDEARAKTIAGTLAKIGETINSSQVTSKTHTQ